MPRHTDEICIVVCRDGDIDVAKQHTNGLSVSCWMGSYCMKLKTLQRPTAQHHSRIDLPFASRFLHVTMAEPLAVYNSGHLTMLCKSRITRKSVHVCMQSTDTWSEIQAMQLAEIVILQLQRTKNAILNKPSNHISIALALWPFVEFVARSLALDSD